MILIDLKYTKLYNFLLFYDINNIFIQNAFFTFTYRVKMVKSNNYLIYNYYM